MEQNQREHFRQVFQNPLCADMTIVKIKDNQIDAKRTKTCILDIGPGGLRFYTNLKLPVNPYIVLEFQTRIMGQILSLPGYVVRKIDTEEFHEYGVRFVLDEQQQMELSSLLNTMTIRMRRNPNIRSCALCDSKNRVACMREMEDSFLNKSASDSPSP
ncbi:PilZ domain-containing protein [Aneurinibacillus soli]|uniref:PilZ domain protein n=1 Tax=Aneurinibacillus soli TaxID=1500254 RepID=A0A0U5BDZ0_9BACL|nr:PilZ domain-containing protein [Aneurinibacillus soli]PYE59490.1 PilZ domain-containing protein [Aneurinibacillus soli]BAU29180.1 PilZ domain protein [Aneurinibacillus soli]